MNGGELILWWDDRTTQLSRCIPSNLYQIKGPNPSLAVVVRHSSNGRGQAYFGKVEAFDKRPYISSASGECPYHQTNTLGAILQVLNRYPGNTAEDVHVLTLYAVFGVWCLYRLLRNLMSTAMEVSDVVRKQFSLKHKFGKHA